MSFIVETAYALATKGSLDWIPNSVADELKTKEGVEKTWESQ